MKTLLLIVFGVSMCCLLPSNGMAADEAKPALFTIVSAQYGAGDEWSDVSDKVKAAVQNDALIIDPANSNFGDPIGGTKKTLKVVVKYNGKEFAFQTGIDGIAGNYVVFRNQTAGEFAIFPYCISPSRIAINGIQIVANSAPGERVISINFTALSDASAVLGSADVAGVIPRANWNNIQYNGNTYGVNPKDDTGTTLESTYVNCRLNSGYPGNHGYTSTVGNDRLMKYFCGNDEGTDSKRLALIRVSGLPASFLATGYSIYVYSDSDFNNNSDPHKIDLGTSLLDTNNQSAGISTISTATIVDSDNWPGSGGGTFTEGATLTINKAVLDAKVGGGVPVAGAVLWIDASTLSAGSYDASTTPVSNLGTQGGTFSAGPYSVNATGINGKPALEFNGTSDYLKSTDAYANSGTTLTMFMVQKRITDKGSWKSSVSCTYTGTSDNIDVRNFAYNQDDSGNLMVSRALNNKASIAHPGDGTPFISTVVFDNVNCTQYLKTSSGSSSASSGSSDSFGCTQTVLAARQEPEVTNYSNINIGEVLIYNSALSTADQEAVESYLAAKWGIGTGIGRPKQGGVLNTRRDPPAASAQTGDPAKQILHLTGGAASAGVVTLSAEAAALVDAGADWNQWRGPRRNGVVVGGPRLSARWSEKGPELVWQSEPIPSGGDGGFGSCVTYKNRVYLFVNWKNYPNQGAAADVVVCLDANTGKTLWKTVFPGRKYGSGTSSTPCVYDGKVYAVGGNGMYCLDAATGAEIWKVPSVGNELSSSPTIVGGVLAVSTGTLKGFDPANGKELWACPQAGTGNGLNTSPGVWVTDKGPLIITNMGNLTCVNPKDGSVVWQSEGANCNSTPAVAGDVCIAGSPLAGYRLLPDKAEKLFGSGLQDQGASHLLYNDHLFAYAGGALRCLDLTGKELWAQGVGGEISSPVLADGKIFAVCGDRKLVMTDATTAKPAKPNKVRVPVLECTSPAVADGKLFLRLKTAVACYDLTKGPGIAK